MCDNFAKETLVVCPADIKQRVADGLGTTLAALKSPCGPYTFDFQAMLESDPTANLPVLFSSEAFRSLEVEPTTVTANPGQMVEYWYGHAPAGATSFFCARSDSIYTYNAGGVWHNRTAFKSTLNASMWYTYDPPNTISVRVSKPPVPSFVIGTMAGVTACQMSGDGEKYFVRNASGWLQHTGGLNWEPVHPGTDFWLSPSFDGTCFILSRPRSRTVFYTIGNQTKDVSIPAQLPVENDVFTAALGCLFFIVRGREVFTIGSALAQAEVIFEFEADTVATGVWADALTVWVSTNKGTYMSNDAGCFWFFQEDAFAVGPGVYRTEGSNIISVSSDKSFSDSMNFPLRLSNRGLLYSVSNRWQTWFETKNMTTAFTQVPKGAPATLSNNGLWLVTQDKDVVTLYLNVWNSPAFSSWCSTKDCKSAFEKYCALFKDIDKICQTPIKPDPDKPDPDKPADDSLSVGTIALIVLGALLGIGIIVAIIMASQKSKVIS
jgi:hypothetical protein